MVGRWKNSGKPIHINENAMQNVIGLLGKLLIQYQPRVLIYIFLDRETYFVVTIITLSNVQQNSKYHSHLYFHSQQG